MSFQTGAWRATPISSFQCQIITDIMNLEREKERMKLIKGTAEGIGINCNPTQVVVASCKG
jgi:hypothetical protein